MVLTPIIKSDDPHFNHRAAQLAAEAVMKMDEDEARIFTSFVVSDVLEEDIEKNLRTLQRRLDTVVAKRIERVKKALISTTVSKGAADQEALAYAQALSALEEISKANPYDYGYRFDENDFRRDPKTGQFQTKIKHTQRRPISDRDARVVGIDQGAPGSEKRKIYNKLSREAKAQYQDEYRQISNFLGAVYQSTKNPGDTDVMVHVQGKDGSRRIVRPTGMKVELGQDYNPEQERIIGVAARPKGLNLGGASFGLTSALGAPQGRRSVEALNRAEDNFGTFSNDWTKPGDNNSNTRLYNRVAGGSKFVEQVAPYGSKLQIAGAFGRIVGEHGQEAEKVFGPATRKAGYRYRGTEKKPDTELLNSYRREVGIATRPDRLTDEDQKKIRSAQSQAELQERERKWREINEGQDTIPGRGKFTPLQEVTLSREEKGAIRTKIRDAYVKQKMEEAGPTETGIEAGRAVLLQHLQERMPDKDLYELHLDAGNTPPSEGFLIDRHGQIHAQAVGYGDDHYLPFNLKNLAALKGGEYIRTRSVGGPTSEDIYTGLMAGARRLTVTSRSGTFTINFEDDFRGGRRHNQKAHRMVRRYEQILDSVQSGSVERKDVNRDTKAMFRNEIERDYPALSDKAKREMLTTKIQEYKRDPIPTQDQEDALEQHIQAQTRGMPEPRARAIRQKILNDNANEREFFFHLNGVGYAAALEALREQFPYYITVEHVATVDPDRREFSRDKGYVEPGRNRPTQAKAGWHGTGTNKGEKVSASTVDYQNESGLYGVRTEAPKKVGEDEREAAAAKEKAAETKAENGEKDKEAATIAGRVQERKAAVKFKPEAMAIWKKISKETWGETPEQQQKVRANFPILFMDEKEAERSLEDPRVAKQLVDFVQTYRKELTTTGPQGQAAVLSYQDLTRFQAASGRIGRQPYDKATRFTSKEVPRFTETRSGARDAYKEDAPAEQVEKEAEVISEITKPTTTSKKLKEMSEAELLDELANLQNFQSALQAVGNDAPLEEKLKKIGPDGMGFDTSNAGVVELVEKPDIFDRVVEDVHRMRALNLNRKVSEAGDIQVSVRTGSAREESREDLTFDRDELKHRADMMRAAAKRATRSSRATLARRLEDDANTIEGLLSEGSAAGPSDVRMALEQTAQSYETAQKLVEEVAREAMSNTRGLERTRRYEDDKTKKYGE